MLVNRSINTVSVSHRLRGDFFAIVEQAKYHYHFVLFFGSVVDYFMNNTS